MLQWVQLLLECFQKDCFPTKYSVFSETFSNIWNGNITLMCRSESFTAEWSLPVAAAASQHILGVVEELSSGLHQHEDNVCSKVSKENEITPAWYGISDRRPWPGIECWVSLWFPHHASCGATQLSLKAESLEGSKSLFVFPLSELIQTVYSPFPLSASFTLSATSNGSNKCSAICWVEQVFLSSSRLTCLLFLTWKKKPHYLHMGLRR